MGFPVAHRLLFAKHANSRYRSLSKGSVWLSAFSVCVEGNTALSLLRWNAVGTLLTLF